MLFENSCRLKSSSCLTSNSIIDMVPSKESNLRTFVDFLQPLERGLHIINKSNLLIWFCALAQLTVVNVFYQD